MEKKVPSCFFFSRMSDGIQYFNMRATANPFQVLAHRQSKSLFMNQPNEVSPLLI